MHNLKYYLTVLLLAILFASCEKNDPTVIDPTLSFPSILSTTFSPNVFDSVTVRAVATAHVTSQEPILSVVVTVVDPLNTKRQFTLHDDGIAPDSISGDGIFSGYVTFTMDCRVVGPYIAQFLAENQVGLYSALVTQTFNVINSNGTPPLITAFTITPNNVILNDSLVFIFWASVTDPNGICDIQKVICTGTKPDGSQITTPPIFNDNGTPPDTTAGDGHFTAGAYGGPPELGYYRYYVKAYNRSGDSSNVLADSIYVHQ